MDIGKLAYERLKKISKEIRKKFPFVIGLKLSGSLSEGHYFYLQFGDEYVSSDYDVVILVNKYPSEKEINDIYSLLSKQILNIPEERIILRDLDIKILTTVYPYMGSGVKIASIYDNDIDVQRHLIGGKVIFGRKEFEKIKPESEWVIRQLVHRITKRKQIIDCFIDLGYLDRIATLLNLKDKSRKIRSIVRKFRNYHILTDDDIKKLIYEVKKIKKEMEKYIP